MNNIDLVVRGYITAMQWASTDFDGESLENYEVSNEAHDKAVADCTALLETKGSVIEIVKDLHPDYTYEHVGHDLFLTREGHGVGFWDRGFGHLGDVLTKYCKDIGECQPYVGDDGLIYFS